MEIKTTKKMIEVEEKHYIAEDGTIFLNEKDCQNHEIELNKQQLISDAKSLEIKDLRGTYPLDVDGQYVNNNNGFRWYRINNEGDFYIIVNAYLNNDYITLPKQYPEIICIEEHEDDMDNWYYYLSDMKNSCVSFWEKHGYVLDFKKIK